MRFGNAFLGLFVAPLLMGLSPTDHPTQLNPAKVLDSEPVWQLAKHEIYSSQQQLDDMQAGMTPREIDRFILRRGSKNEKLLALTFDDGPHPATTEKLLKILIHEDVKATFFLIGHMAQKYPNLVREISRAGYEIGNHSFSHASLTQLTPTEITTEYKAANLVLSKVSGMQIRYCRPPGGDLNADVLKSAALLHLKTVLWTDDPGDYLNLGKQTLLDRELKKLSEGGIILLHDGPQDTLDTLVQFIEEARKQGYRFVSLDELSASNSSTRRIQGAKWAKQRSH